MNNLQLQHSGNLPPSGRFIWHLLNHLVNNTTMLSRQSRDKIQKGSRSHGEPYQSGKPPLIKQLCFDRIDEDWNLEGTLEYFWLRCFL